MGGPPVLALRTRAHQLAPEAGLLSSDDTVGRLLKQQGDTLQRTQKTEEGAQHPDRDAQFRYVNEQAKTHLAAGQPVVSVDTKKKELVGRYANGGAEWQPAGELERVGVHDFPDPKVGKAIPYGVWRFCLKSAGRRGVLIALVLPALTRFRPLGAPSPRRSLSDPAEPRTCPQDLSPNRLGNPGSLGRNELVGKNRGQAEGLSRRISATRAGCSRAAKCPL